MSESSGMTPEQKTFLQGLAIGSDVARTVRGLPIIAGSAAPGQTVTVGAAAAAPPAGGPATGRPDGDARRGSRRTSVGRR